MYDLNVCMLPEPHMFKSLNSQSDVIGSEAFEGQVGLDGVMRVGCSRWD